MILSGLVTTIVAIWLLPALLFLACSAIRILDGGPSWLLVLGIGTLVTTLAYITVLVHPNSATAAGTIAEVATLYVFPLGLIWFALPALMLFRDGSRLTDWHIWAITGALTLGLILWLAPLFYAGQMGQPFRYVDYPDAFSIANLVSSMAVIAFTALMLGIIVILRRTRA